MINWGDGVLSGCDSNGTMSHTYTSVGNFDLRARACCNENNDVQSELSD